MISTHLTIGLELHFIKEEAHTENKDQRFSQNNVSKSSLHYCGRGIFTWLAESWQRRGSVREQDQEAQSLTRLMGPLMTESESELVDESDNVTITVKVKVIMKGKVKVSGSNIKKHSH